MKSRFGDLFLQTFTKVAEAIIKHVFLQTA